MGTGQKSKRKMKTPPVKGGYRPAGEPTFRKKLGLPSPTTKGSGDTTPSGAAPAPTQTTTYMYRGQSYSSEAEVKAAIGQNIISNLPAQKQEQFQQAFLASQTTTGVSVSGTGAGTEEPETAVPSGTREDLKGFESMGAGQEGAVPLTADDITDLLALGVGGILSKGFFKIGKIAGKETIGKAAGGQLSKGILSKQLGLYGKHFATNTKTDKLTSKLLVKLGLGLGAVFIVKDAIGTYPFAKFELAEAADKIGMAKWQALKAGEPELVLELDQITNEIFNPDIIGTIISWIPWANIARAARINGEMAVRGAKVFDYLAEKEKERIDNGETDADMWVKINADKEKSLEEERAYWDEVKKYEEEAATAEKEYWKLRDEKNAKLKAEERAYWEKVARDKDKREAEKRAYWEQIRLSWAKAKEENRKSTLKFGLL